MNEAKRVLAAKLTRPIGPGRTLVRLEYADGTTTEKPAPAVLDSFFAALWLSIDARTPLDAEGKPIKAIDVEAAKANLAALKVF